MFCIVPTAAPVDSCAAFQCIKLLAPGKVVLTTRLGCQTAMTHLFKGNMIP